MQNNNKSCKEIKSFLGGFLQNMEWDGKTQFLDEYYYDLHWIIIRQVRRKLDPRYQCLYGKERPMNLPDFYQDYYKYWECDKETNKKSESWSKTLEKTYFAHLMICEECKKNINKIKKNKLFINCQKNELHTGFVFFELFFSYVLVVLLLLSFSALFFEMMIFCV